MSYQLFKSELKLKLFKQHDDDRKVARVLAAAYDKLVLRHFDIITGGGKVIGSSAKVPILRSGIEAILRKNKLSDRRVNFFNDIAPYIKAYWSGLTIVGSLGTVIISNTGVFKGPPVVENNNIDIWLSILQGVVAVHMVTMTGTYTNYYTGVTIPWSSASLKTTP